MILNLPPSTPLSMLPSAPQLIRSTQIVILVSILAAAIAPRLCAQQPPPEQWREVPPRNAVQTMRKSVRMGTKKGFTAKLKGVEITDKRFQPFLIQITVTGEKRFKLYRVQFVTDGGTFNSELPKKTNARWDVGLANAPTNADATFHARETEERTFNITLPDATLLSTTSTLKVTLIGAVHEREYTIKRKQLASLNAWFTERIGQRND